MDAYVDFVVLDEKLRRRDRQLEAARAGTSRIDVKQPIALLDNGLVGMAEDDDPDLGGQCGEVKFRDIVDDMHVDAAEPDELAVLQPPRPLALVVVATHCGDRRDACQLFDDAWLADVAGMNDVVAAFEEGSDFGPQQSVRVRQQSDPQPGAGSFRFCWTPRTPVVGWLRYVCSVPTLKAV